MDLAVIESAYLTLQDAQRVQHRAQVATRAARRSYHDLILPALYERVKAIEKITGRGLCRFSDYGRIGNVDIIQRRGDVLLRIEIQDGSEREPPCDTLLLPLNWLDKPVEECCALIVQLRAEHTRLKRERVAACTSTESICTVSA